MAETFKEQFTKAMREHFSSRNLHALPQIRKVLVTVGVGKFRQNKRYLDEVEKTLQLVTGQKPIPTKAHKAIAGFKLRQGEVVGYMVTLRGKRMWDLLQKLVHIDLPRVRDFRGIQTKSIDRTGNYTIAFTEQAIFPEIPSEQVEHIHGIALHIATTAKNPQEGRTVLESLGIPFNKAQ